MSELLKRDVLLGPAIRIICAGLLGGAFAATLYVSAFNFLVPQPRVPFIKETMLEFAPGPRLIIDSGSSAVYGLNATSIGNSLGRYGFVASDNGDVNPIDKAYRLERFTRPGDAVVLPFEWLHYDVPDQLNLRYIEAATGELSGYYHSLPWRRRLRLIGALPLGISAKIMWRNAVTDHRARAEDPALGIEWQHVMLTGGWDGGQAPPPVGLLPDLINKTCAQSIFDPGQLERGPNKAGIMRILAPLQQMQARGVQVVFIPPVVAGTDCYADTIRVKAYVRALTAILSEAGFRFVGSPGALWFGADAATNTYFHVNLAARAQATSRVVSWLQDAGLSVPAMPRKANIEALVALEQALMKGLWPRLILPAGTEAAANAAAIEAVAGWWGIEAGWGAEKDLRWTRGGDAELRVRVGPGTRTLEIRLMSYVIPEDIQFIVNGRVAGESKIDQDKHVVTLSVPADTQNIDVVLHPTGDGTLRSPLTLGIGSDPRTVGIALLGITARS